MRSRSSTRRCRRLYDPPTLAPAASRCPPRGRDSRFEAARQRLRDHRALRGRRVELAHERIASRGERADVDRRLRLARNHLFAIERMAVELLGRRVLVVDDEPDLHVRRNADFGRHEFVIVERQRELGLVGGLRSAGADRDGDRCDTKEHGGPTRLVGNVYDNHSHSHLASER